jgi:hypothetical protein
MLDRYIEFNKHAQRRMDEHLKPIDSLLMKWAPEARHDGAPRWPNETMLKRIIDQTALGASQSGAQRALDAPADVEFADWAVASLLPDQREVIYAEYVKYAGWSVERKSARVGMKAGQWAITLKEARGGVYLLCRTYGRMLHLEIV